MRLTQIKLAGFKSFVDPTMIPAPGQLVAVVGPNGCGKSNVIDAVRWVLGESSAKQLRGSSMQDVIFNGSGERRPSGRASVELTFENSDQQLSGPWGQYAEVSIKRVLTRQGESSYYINNQIVRRRDIIDLFLGTGVGARGYAVIEQGMISRIIEAKPEELRAYLEEAAGISKYKERRKETEHRLADTRDNLLRVEDLRQELLRQIDRLDEQAAIAAQYHDLRAALTQQQNLLALLRREDAARDAAAAQVALAQSETLETELAARLSRLEIDEHTVRQEQYVANDLVQVAQQRLADVSAQMVRLEEQQRHYQQQQLRIEKETTDIRQLRQRLAQQEQEVAEQLAEYLLRHEEAVLSLTSVQQTLDEHDPTGSANETEFARWDDQLRQLESRQSDLLRERDLNVQRTLYLEKQLSQQQNRLETLTRERTALDLPDSAQLTQAQQQADEAVQALVSVEERLHQDESRLADLNGRKAALDETITVTSSALAAAEAEAGALAAILAGRSTDEILSAWLVEHGLADAPQLWQHVQVDSEWQQAFEIVLADRLSARAGHLPDEYPDSGLTLIDRKISEATAKIPPQSLRMRVKADEGFSGILDEWLAGIFCAESLENALSRRDELNHGECWLTQQGHRIYRHGVLLHGENSSGILAQKAAYETAQLKVTQLLPELEGLKQQRDVLKSQGGMLQEAIRVQRDMLTRWQQTRSDTGLHLAKLTQAIQQGGARLNALNEENEHLHQETEHTQEELENARLAQEDIVLTIESLQLSVDEAKQYRQEIETQLQQQRQANRDAERQLHAAQLVLQSCEHKVEELQRRQAELSERDVSLQERLEGLILEDSQETDDDLDISLQQCLLQRQNVEQQLVEAREAYSLTDEQWRELAQQQQSLRDELPKVREQRQQWLLKEQEARLARERFDEELREAGVDVAALIPLLGTAPKSAVLNSEIARLARAVENLGAVNLAALQELESARERNDYLTVQADDLNQAMQMLVDAIAKIDAESRGLLQGTFDTVNSKMREFFPTLFGGGQAQLEMTGDDLLEAGVQIIAHPPGKKNSTIHLLSGGEKALTAMSLVFSLFALNPAPFCLLDEVDAPLDDANTGRFCDLVKQMSARTQFLYISHNRLTMEMAEQLVGVTMQEQGVSRIVAVDIVQALQMRETEAV